MVVVRTIQYAQLAMKDRSLLAERMRAKALQQRYNNYPWPSPEEEPDFFGPDERKAILAELFGLSLEEFKAKPIEIEPPFFCDFGMLVCPRVHLDHLSPTEAPQAPTSTSKGLSIATRTFDHSKFRGASLKLSYLAM